MTSWDRAIERQNAALPLSVSPTLPGYDPLDALPPEACSKLLELRQAARDAHLTLMGMSDEINELRTQRQQAEVRIRQLTLGAGLGGFQLDPSDPRVVAEQAKADRLATEIGRLSAISDARSARRQELQRLVSSLDAWLSRQGGRELVAYVGPAPKLGRGETASDAVERCRRRLRELRADLARIEAAPIPSSVAKEKARAEVMRLAAQGRPNVAAMVEAGQKIEWPLARTDVSAWREGRPDPNVPLVRAVDPVALAAWLDPDALLAALEREIDELADDEAALSDEARAAKRTEILADLLAVERDEEAFILQAAASGAEILRRPDADPRAVLGLVGA